MRPPSRPTPTDRLAEALRGFGPVGVAVTLVIFAAGPILEPLGGLLVLAWAALSRTPWSDLGFARPRSWPLTIAVGMVFGVAFKFVMKAVVMRLLGAPDMNPAYHFLVGNTAALPGMVFDVVVGAGFAEEAVFRGFAFERLGRLFGPGAGAKALIVLLTSVWFGAVHFPVQRLAGAEQALITGLAFGTIYAATGRLWMLMIAHAAFDLTAVWMIYWNLEARIAHLVFK